jgi:hypothetical protein
MLVCALPLAHATTTFLIANGTFETGTVAGWTPSSSAFSDTAGSCNDGFAAQSTAAGCVVGTAPAFGTFAAYTSTSFPAITNDVGEWTNNLSQNFAVPLAPINSANLSLEYAATWGGSGNSRGVGVLAQFYQGSTFLTNTYFVDDPSASGSVGWTLSNTDITALLSAHAGQILTLELSTFAFYDTRGGPGTSATTLNAGFDNVQITVDSGVPEPGTTFLAGGGLALVVVSRLIRRRF